LEFSVNSQLPSTPPAQQGSQILEQLQGLTIEGGWLVGRFLPKAPDQTGGFFSRGYECTSPDGKAAFLKAIDLYSALSSPDLISALNQLTDGVRCEQELLEICRRMDRVVSALAFGTIREFQGQQLQIPIPFIVFEKADGDIRHVVRASSKPTHEWCLRTLHHVATGMMQLHRERIAHQDLKLSNALNFDDGRTIKIADLGRSVRQGRAVWYDQYPWPGANAYAPPEIAYGFVQSEFGMQRFSSDLFLLGSFATSVFTGVPFNLLLYSNLAKDFWPPMFGGAYAGTFEHVSAHLQDAFEKAFDVVQMEFPIDATYREETLLAMKQWCAPDPRDRGHPRTRAINANAGNIFDLERYVSLFPNLAAKAAAYERMKRRK
jgi:serine/threonine protein kinase